MTEINKNSISKKNRNKTMDLIRGIGIIIVVIGHSIQVNLQKGENYFLWNKIILAFQMPLMFYISGMTIKYSYSGKNPKLFIKKKTTRLFIPYLIWILIHYIIVCIQDTGYRSLSFYNTVKEIFYSDFWFLRYLYVFFIVIWSCDVVIWIVRNKFNKSLNKDMILIMSVIIVIFLSRVPIIKESLSLWYYLWFLVGYFVDKFLENRLQYNRITNTQKIIITSVFIAIIVITSLIQLKINLPQKMVAIVYVLGIYIIFFVVANTSWRNNIVNVILNRVNSIGSNTLPIYAIHWCLFFSTLWRVDFYTSVLGNIPITISSFIVAVTWLELCLLVIKIMRSWKFSSILLLGEKGKIFL